MRQKKSMRWFMGTVLPMRFCRHDGCLMRTWCASKGWKRWWRYITIVFSFRQRWRCWSAVLGMPSGCTRNWENIMRKMDILEENTAGFPAMRSCGNMPAAGLRIWRRSFARRWPMISIFGITLKTPLPL